MAHSFRTLALLVVLAGCSAPAPRSVCTPGRSESCVGPGGCAGAQVCNAEGSGYGACDCGSGGGAGGGTGGGAGGGSGGGAGGGGQDAGASCNPLGAPGAQGCATGQKCTWIILTSTPETTGRLGCVADGTVPPDQACVRGPDGETTGFDNCTAGNVCVNGQCADICGFGGGAGAACAAGFTCVRYAELFSNGAEEPVAGACNPSCDPLSQTSSDGGTCGAGRGCYVLTSLTDTITTCAGAGTVGHGVAITGAAYANSCVPGAIPRRRSDSSFECGMLCRPADVTSTTNTGSEGGVSPDDCATRSLGDAGLPSDTGNGESCRYYWALETFDYLSAYSNTLGFCFQHATRQYDSNGDSTPDAPFPRCTSLTTGDVVPPIGNPPHNDAQYFWCVAAPASLLPYRMPKDLVPELPRPDRIGNWR